MGDTGIEPVTSSVSTKRSTPELTARGEDCSAPVPACKGRTDPAGPASDPVSHAERVLSVPVFFDDAIGYWTGEYDLGLVDRVTAEWPAPPSITWSYEGGRIRLRGPQPELDRLAERWLSAGLFE